MEQGSNFAATHLFKEDAGLAVKYCPTDPNESLHCSQQQLMVSPIPELTHEYQSMFEGTGGHSAPSSSWMTKTLAEPSCSGKGLAYSPAHCLFDAGWGSMMFSLSTEPPFDGVLAVSEMSQRGSVRRPQPFVQPVANGSESLDLLVDAADRVYKRCRSVPSASLN
eukprot:s882_g5.t1